MLSGRLALFSASNSVLSRARSAFLTLAVELISQRPEIRIQLLALLLRQLERIRDSSRLLAESCASSSSSTVGF